MNMVSRIQAEMPTIPVEAPGKERRPRRRWRTAALVAIGLALAGGAGWKAFDRPQAEAAVMPQPTVGVAAPLVRKVVLWDDYVGRFAPSQAVEVRPRVSGQIVALHFHDGDIVRKGQPLFTIDQRPFLAALAEARANAASARSALRLAQADYGRVSRLTGDEAVSAAEVDSLRARLQAAQAALAAADARVRQLALNVEFTVVRAPITGRVSDRRIDVGNLVSGADAANATLLTTINALDPIYFTFDASEALFLKTQRDRAEGKGGGEVEIRLQDEGDFRWKGRLDFTDNGLDPRSGTIRGRAVLSNPELFLTAGMFGNMRLSNGGEVDALLVPDEAIQSDQARKVVLVAGADGVVAAKPVELGPVVDGLRVIRSGLARSDRVIVSNIQAAATGAKVLTRAAPIQAAKTPAAQAGGSPPPAASQATFAR
ncbi:efflux RND transporter periplasmic adaptor subunit [Novosphingobium sp. MD-1]|uniref:efflux RND transporter periplasmic adaptor subunit n=1 Tax=Novosphingobium sp. MD-1 TaxID=1630648 RepID=UPI00061CB556|nr:efflux RND transporter periplasmic adaptor subunit [Novosphingobium sp. MD-1]GAO53347.1 Co/Zn/Cd efflux system membrane fusion protein [Novosphingobium sp. MD-1]